MKIYLAGPHMLTRFKNGYQFALSVFGYEDIFSRRKWKEENNNCIMGGENCVKRYLNENISGDSRGGTGLPEPFRGLLENNADIFSGGESRHWIHEASPVKEKGNEMKIYLASVCSTGTMNVQLQSKDAEIILSGEGLSYEGISCRKHNLSEICSSEHNRGGL